MPRPKTTPFQSGSKEKQGSDSRRYTLLNRGHSEYKRNTGLEVQAQGSATIVKEVDQEDRITNPSVVSLAKFETMRVSVKNFNTKSKKRYRKV